MLLRVTLVALLFSCLLSGLSAQDLSNKGTDFWVVYAGHIDATTSRMALYITSDQNATGTVDINGSIIPFSVAANQVATVQLTSSSNPSNSIAYNNQVVGVGTKKGIHITATKPVVVYSHILNAARSGSTMVLPTNVLGKEYYVSSYQSTSGGATHRSQFDVIATVDNTTVEITPTGADGLGTHLPNATFQVTLSKGDIYQYQSDVDLTGTHIKSIGTGMGGCQPIAVFSGSMFTSMGCPSAGSGDNLYQELFPFAAWGKLYYTAPFISRAYDIFRIIIQDPTEPVYVNGVALNLSSLIGGRYYEFNTQGNNTARVISSNKPICVFQYLITQSCDGVNSDPEMVALNSVEQTLNDITVMSARNNLTPPNTNIVSHYLNIIFKSNTFNSLRIDGNVPTAVPVPITGTSYSYIQQDVTISTNSNPAHHITSDSGFICIAYGYGNVESYGYNAGANIKDLYQFISLQNQYATVSFPAACRNSPFHFSMTFPYQPTQIAWQFNGLFADTTINMPVYDSTWIVNGKQLYLYKLPTSYAVSALGTYPIKVLAQNPSPDGCSGLQEITYDLQVFERPVADFTINATGCFPDSVHFTNTSNTNGRPAYVWSWSFGDGGTSSSANTVHLFNSPGSYTVKYSIITDIGCLSDTARKDVALTPVPVAKFSFSSPQCAAHNISFSDSSYAPGSILSKWYWDFGDGTPVVAASNGNAQGHSFATAGNYTVTLRVENATGCQSNPATLSITIHPNPVVAFNIGDGCLPQASLLFTSGSTISDGSQNSFIYHWSFGDGGNETIASPAHTYLSTGPFNANLVVISNAGCMDSLSKPVTTIHPQPVAAFTASAYEICPGTVINFTDGSVVNSSSITQWQWVFGDNNSSTLQNPSNTFTIAGTYLTKLVAVSGFGCPSDTARKTIFVNPAPVASFQVSSPRCETKDIVFTDLSIPSTTSLVKWSWDLADGTSFIRTNNIAFTHNYTAAGTYHVKLQVENDKGCLSRVDSLPVVINPMPHPGFSMPGNCLTDPFTQFTDTSTIADGSNNSFTYQWNFGDQNATPSNPNTSTLKDPQHKFTAVGNYNVTLTVTSAAGCTASQPQQFTINGTTPQSGFSFVSSNPGCSNDSVILKNNSTVDFGNIVKLEIFWDNANNLSDKTIILNPAPGANIIHSYPEFYSPATKSYDIRIIAYSGDNCFHSSSQTVTIKATPQLQFDAIPAVCRNAPAFQVNQTSVVNALPGSGQFSGNGISVQGLFNPPSASAGIDTVTYTYTASNNCKNTVSQTVTVFPVPVANAGPDLFVLSGGMIQLQGSASGSGLTYLWSPARWLSDPMLLQPFASPLDTVTYRLAVTSSDGCISTDAVYIKVLKAPEIPNVFTPNGDNINDRWEIKYLDSYPNATVEVYNRYGQLVFRSKNYFNPWDGTYNGKQIPVGTYYYIIIPGNGRKQLSGFVDVIR
jgi:gliding motility-associated-like protein